MFRPSLWKSLTPASTAVMETLAIESRRIKCTRCHHASSTSVTTFNSADYTNGSASSMCDAPQPEFVLSGALGGELSHYINEFVSANLPLQRWRVLFYPLQTALNLQLPLTPLVPLVKMLVKESPYKCVVYLFVPTHSTIYSLSLISGPFVSSAPRFWSIICARRQLSSIAKFTSSSST